MGKKGRSKDKKTVLEKGKKSQEQRHYNGLKTWLARQGEDVNSLSEEAGEDLLKTIEKQALLRWIPRLFWESPEEDRKKILIHLTSILADDATLFFKEVLDSQESALREKQLAFKGLQEQGCPVESALGEALEKAVDFIEVTFPESIDGSASPEEVFEKGWVLFQGLPGELHGPAVKSLIARYPGHAFGFVEYIVDKNNDLWEVVIPAIADNPHQSAAGLLSAAYKATADKGVEKMIRKIHHKRRAQGLIVYDLKDQEAGEAVWHPPVPPKPIGLMAMPDGYGSRMIWVIRANISKGMLVFSGWVDDRLGLKQFLLTALSNREMERFKDSLLTSREHAVVEIDPGYCAFLIKAAYKQRPPANPEELNAFRQFRPQLKALLPQEVPQAPIYEIFSGQVGEDMLVDPWRQSGHFPEQELPDSWEMDSTFLKPYLERLDEISKSRIIMNPMQKKERIDSFFVTAADEIFSDSACRESWRKMFEDGAWVYYKKGHNEQAKRYAAAARFLKDKEKNASRLNILLALVRKMLEKTKKRVGNEEKGSVPLIIT